ncbi:DUF1254 domain-containing protein [Psychrilyobacter atlanticus]|uniref:DUF1254 domain-containing protein n=1 Tax=Psychrilyobacter atlanticus TaxID=271091 RepID=UPI00042445A7|nr:DUF1254 domain-containing protein [Psychrilyobacter atlanticus]
MKKVLLGVMLVAALGACVNNEMKTETNQQAGKEQTVDKTKSVMVTKTNFKEAETNAYFMKQWKKQGEKANVLVHERKFVTVETQDVVRMNRDTLYSRSIIDVSEGATISLEKYEGYQTVLILDSHHNQVASIQNGESLTIDKDNPEIEEGEFLYVLARTGVNTGEDGLKDAHAAQDKINIEAKSAQEWIPKNFDKESLDIVNVELQKDFASKPYRLENGFGTKNYVDFETATVASALGWGGYAKEQAVYSLFNNDKPITVTFEKPDLDFDNYAFYSITVYDKTGWIATKEFAINSSNMEPNADGSYTVNFGKPGTKNNLDIPEGRYTGGIRAYMPKNVDETLDWAYKSADKIKNK